MDRTTLLAALSLLSCSAPLACAKGQDAPPTVVDSGAAIEDTRPALVDTALADVPADAPADAPRDGLGDVLGDVAADGASDADSSGAVVDAPGDDGDGGPEVSLDTPALDAVEPADTTLPLDAPSSGSTAVVLLGCNGGGLVEARWTRAASWSPVTAIPGASCKGPPAIASLSTDALSAVRVSDDTLGAARYATTRWGAFTRALAPSTTLDRPALATTASGAYLAFLDGANTLQGAAYTEATSSWGALEPLPGAFGPTGPALAVVLGTPLTVFRGSDTFFYVAERTSGTWGASTKIGATVFTTSAIPPQLVATGATSPDAELVYVGSDDKLYVSSRIGGSFQPAVKVAPGTTDASTTKGFSFARTASSAEAFALAFVGTDGKAYTMLQAFAGGAFTAATPIDASTDAGAVALSAGVEGDDAMLVIGAGATTPARYARLTGSIWSTPLALSAAVEAPALGTTP